MFIIPEEETQQGVQSHKAAYDLYHDLVSSLQPQIHSLAGLFSKHSIEDRCQEETLQE